MVFKLVAIARSTLLLAELETRGVELRFIAQIPNPKSQIRPPPPARSTSTNHPSPLKYRFCRVQDASLAPTSRGLT